MVVSDENSNPVSTRSRSKNDFESFIWIFFLVVMLQRRKVYLFWLSNYISSGFCFDFKGNSVKK